MIFRLHGSNVRTFLLITGVILIATQILLLQSGQLLPKKDWLTLSYRSIIKGIGVSEYYRKTKISNPMYQLRWMRLRDHCLTNYPKVNPSNLSDSDISQIKESKYILVDDKHEVVYCKIPKIACTTWQRMFLAMHGFKDALNMPQDDVHHRQDSYNFFKSMELRKQSYDNIRRKLQTYKTFVIVRDPLERILSAYRDKLLMGREFYAFYSKRILRAYREGYKAEDDVDLEFHEFIRFLLDQERFQIGYVDEHWDSFFNECLPCSINYDVIGKYETMETDSNFVLQYLGWNKQLKWPPREKHYNGTRSALLIDQAYNGVSKRLLSGIKQHYRDDILAFGYANG